MFLFGAIVPFVETGIGIGLLTNKYRKKAVLAALLMSGFILFTLGPLGHNWNSTVWPWNVAMVFFVIILFWHTEKFSFRDVLFIKNSLFQKIILLLFVVMPVFSFFNMWDSYLSSALYSGNTDKSKLYITDSFKKELPSKIQDYVNKSEEGESVLDIFGWSYAELNSPIYPETRIYKDITKNICKYGKENRNITLVVSERKTLFGGDNKLTYRCSDL